MLIKKNALVLARETLCVSRRLGPFNHGGILVSKLSTLSKPLPKGAWDSHMHIVNPHKFPLDPTAQYVPHLHTIADARAFYEPLGIKNYVIVQPSIYGNDNSCTLDALRAIGPRHGRAVVQFDPKAMPQRILDEWHHLGVRGVRVNLVSVGRELNEQELRAELMEYANVIRRLDWVLEVYLPLKMATAMEKIVPELDVKVCIDHFGQPTLATPYDVSKPVKPYDLPGFKSLVNLLQGDTWVKMSGQYRVSKDPEMRDLEPVAMELLKMAPDRVVFASDWPHTRYESVDSIPFIEACFRWSGEGTGVAEKLFVKNAEELWDVSPSAEP